VLALAVAAGTLLSPRVSSGTELWTLAVSPPDFREFLESINAAGVEYLLVGGYAVCFHGYPRVTSDMEVWIRRACPDPASPSQLSNI